MLGGLPLLANLAQVVQLAMPDGTSNPQLGRGESRRSAQVWWEKETPAAMIFLCMVQKQDQEPKFPEAGRVLCCRGPLLEEME